MNRLTPLILIAAGILAFATVFLVILPADEIRTADAPEGLAPYTEADAPHPVNVYGRSKLDFEARLQASHSPSNFT